MASDKKARIEAVAKAILAAEFDGNVTFDSFREWYGDHEASMLRHRLEHAAKQFLAAFDAANQFPTPRR